MRMIPADRLCLVITAVALSAVAVPYAGATALDVRASGEKTFTVNSGAGNSQVTIFSESVLADFTTVCNRVTGEWHVDPKNLEALRGHFAMRVVDMQTGMDVRDRDMHGPDWFDAPHYPNITVDVDRVTNVRRISANSAKLNLVGACSMHGHTKPVSIPCTVSYLDESPLTRKVVAGDVLRLRGEFVIKLSDYGITGPAGTQMIGVSVANDQDIKFTIFAASGPTDSAADPGPDTGANAAP